MPKTDFGIINQINYIDQYQDFPQTSISLFELTMIYILMIGEMTCYYGKHIFIQIHRFGFVQHAIAIIPPQSLLLFQTSLSQESEAYMMRIW